MVVLTVTSRSFSGPSQAPVSRPKQSLGLTGLEPVTLRLSSACSNQLSYRPGVRIQLVQAYPFGSSSRDSLRIHFAASKSLAFQTKPGGKGTRTPGL